MFDLDVNLELLENYFLPYLQHLILLQRAAYDAHGLIYVDQ